MRRTVFMGAAFLIALTVIAGTFASITSDLKAEFAGLRADMETLKRATLSNVRYGGGLSDVATNIRGWAVRIYQVPTRGSDVPGEDSFAGSFVHTGSWIALDEYKKHEGIFLSGNAELRMQGQFKPKMSGDYLFAVHMKVATKAGEENRDVPTVSCYARVNDQNHVEIIKGKMLVDSARMKGALISTAPVFVGKEAPRLLKVSFQCNGVPKLDSSRILFRICFRKIEEASFRPLVPNLNI